jgi:hypothetical protein
MPTPLIGALAVTLMVASTASAGPREQTDVRAREAAFYQAFLDADVAAFTAILAPSFVYQHGSGATFDQPQFLTLLGSGTVKVTRADSPALTFRDYDQTMVTYGQSRVDVEIGATSQSGVLRFVNVWRQDSGQWRLVHRNSEFLPPSTQ